MDGVLPISLSLTDDSARIIGAYVRSGLVDVVRPPLDRIEAHLLELNNGLRMLSIDVVGGGVIVLVGDRSGGNDEETVRELHSKVLRWAGTRGRQGS